MHKYYNVVFALHVGIWLRSKGKHWGNLFSREEMMWLSLLELVLLAMFHELIMVWNVRVLSTGTTLLHGIKSIELN